MAATYIYSFWNSIKTVCQAFDADSRYEVIILLPDQFYDKVYDNVKKAVLEFGRYQCIAETAYNFEKEQPDILLVTFLGRDVCLFPNCRDHLQYFKLIVAVTDELISYKSDLDEWDGVHRYHYYCLDYYIIDSLLYNYIKTRNILENTMFEMGNAKFDSVYKDIQENADFTGNWKKVKGKKYIMG